MNIEKMTTTLQEAIAEAQQIAVTRKHQDIDIAHLWKIFLQPNHFGRNFYTDAGLDVESFEMKSIVYWMSIQLFLVETSNMVKISAKISFVY